MKYLALLLFAPSILLAGKFSTWQYLALDHDLCKDLNIEYEFNSRISGNRADFFYYNQVKLEHRVSDIVRLGSAYRHVKRKSDGNWQDRPQFLFDIHLRHIPASFNIHLRARTQVNFKEHTFVERFRFLKETQPIWKNIYLYILDEIFFSEMKRFTQNRVEAGFKLKAEGAHFYLGFLNRTFRNSGLWSNEHVITTTAVFSF